MDKRIFKEKMDGKNISKEFEIKKELERVTGLSVTRSVGLQLKKLEGLENIFYEKVISPHPYPKRRPKNIFLPNQVYFGGRNLGDYRGQITEYLQFWLPEIKNEHSFSIPVYISLLKYCETKSKDKK